MKVQDIFSSNAGCCGPATNLAEVVHIMWERDCGIVPLVDAMNTVVGVVTDRDICMALGTRDRRASEITAQEVADGMVIACSPEEDVKTVLDRMATEGIRRLPVVNRAGQLLGMVSISDALLAARQARDGRAGEVKWTDVMSALDLICRPRNATPERVPTRASG